MGVSTNRGSPKWMVKIMEKLDDLGWYPTIFGNIQIDDLLLVFFTVPSVRCWVPEGVFLVFWCSFVVVDHGSVKIPIKMGVSKNRGSPKWMVKIMENPIKMGMIWGETHCFRKHPDRWSANHEVVFHGSQKKKRGVKNFYSSVTPKTSWWFQPIWKNMSQNGFIFPNFRGENSRKSLSCYHPVYNLWWFASKKQNRRMQINRRKK